MKQTTNSASRENGIQVQSPELPKGGGAIQGMGETFMADAFSGTGHYTIPVPLTAARGFEPHLDLTYHSGAGNSPFGLGFSIALPNISRRTEKGIPRYNDDDIFLDNHEELVPLQTGQTSFVRTETQGAETWEVREYRPRIEGEFSKIEYWVNPKTQESYWQVIDSDNSLYTYGKTPNARIADPEDSQKIFRWLIETASDAKGNLIHYTYKSENNENVPHVSWEQGRALSNKYLERIQYGNISGTPEAPAFAYEVVLDYGEYELSDLHKAGSNPSMPVNPWAYRPDAFSSYRSGFEIRTRRRCQNILLFHHFEAELGAPCLVKRMALTYADEQQAGGTSLSHLSLLREVQVTGYRRQGGKATDPYEMKSLPPVSLTFSQFHPPESPKFQKLTISGEGPLPGDTFLPVDLEGEGIRGLLYTGERDLYYLAPEGGGSYSPPQPPEQFPNNRGFHEGQVTLTDLDSDGQLEWVVNNGPQAGFYPRQEDNSWGNYRPFEAYPNNKNVPYVEAVDLSATGKNDLLVVEQNELRVYPSQGEDGYAPPISVPKQSDFPIQKQASRQEQVRFANLFGDGLSHRVKITNKSVTCWPDLGYGRFGKKITLGHSPDFGENFDSNRLHLADLDGSGTPDLIYVHPTKVDVFINQSGNTFSHALSIALPETFSGLDRIGFADVLGNGTACLLFSKMGPVPRHYYYNFTGAVDLDGSPQKNLKPYLLNEVNNNLGAITQTQYTSSTQFYLADKKKGRPWVTKIHFPVQVVEQVTTIDEITGARFVQKWAYHDGYYDHVEREFRGFGYVESWDTQNYQTYLKNQAAAGRANTALAPDASLSEALYVPPVYTRSWYHTGVFEDATQVCEAYQAAYFQGDPAAYTLPQTVFGDGCDGDPKTWRQAHVALKGHLIREEVYGDDGSDDAKNPYTVSESNLEVRLLQAASLAPYAVFLVVPRESIDYHYERNPHDPRVQQHFTLKVDKFGHVLQACDMALPRRPQATSQVHPEQQTLKATLEEHEWINETESFHLLGIPAQSQTFELCGLALTANQHYFSFDDSQSAVTQALQTNAIVPYDGALTEGKTQARQLSWVWWYYWNPGQTAVLPLGQVSPQALLHHQETAEFTKAFAKEVYTHRLTDETITTQGGYVWNSDINYWLNQGVVHFYLSESQYCLPSHVENAFVSPSSHLYVKTSLAYDAYYFHPIKVSEYVDATTDNVTQVEMDYITGSPKQLIDLNDNVSQVLFDPLGMVVVSSEFGTQNGELTGGMTLYAADGKPAEYQIPSKTANGHPIDLQDILAHPEYYLQGAADYFYYDLDGWQQDRQPANSVSLVRNHYYHNPQTDAGASDCQIMIHYSDGLGRVLEEKLKTGPGLAFLVNPKGAPSSNSALSEGSANDRWQVSGRTVYNNKGEVCEHYLPYFSNTPLFESQQEVTKSLPPPTVTYYDPLLRVIRVETPKGFFSKVLFTPWEEYHYDEDDTVLESPYYQQFMAHYPKTPTQSQMDEKDALEKAAQFYNTPAIEVLDTLGHAFWSIENNLGNVPSDSFASIVKSNTSVTSESIWQALLKEGYLTRDTQEINGVSQTFYWVAEKFQPYRKGFRLALGGPFTALEAEITKGLLQHCLTTYTATDIQGRVTQTIDPRLYYGNVQEGQSDYNFKYRYTMDESTPAYTDSVDSGVVRHLNDMYGQPLWTLNARNYCQLIAHDRLHRREAVWVKKLPDVTPVTSYADFNLVEQFTYGETQVNATADNLRGQLYQMKDLSGIVLNKTYDIQGNPLSSSRQLVSDYQTAADWNRDVSLEEAVYPTKAAYNAVGHLLQETTPDGSVTSYTYTPAGQLFSVEVHFSDGTTQPIVNGIDYDANNQRTQLQYGNGMVTTYTHELETLRLVGIESIRKRDQNTEKVQDVTYTYDPVGNLTRSWDLTIQTVFFKNQKVQPLSDYTYDALYRLRQANGRQHPGIQANTYKNDAPSFKQSLFSQLPSTNQAEALENYSETYHYDEAGNLISQQHKASSARWTRTMAVESNSNRLASQVYDAAGNQRSLNINPPGKSAVTLSFNCCNNLVKAGVILRPEKGQDDCDYYLYDSHEQRTRKVSARMGHGGAVTQLQEKIYLGSYEIKRNKTINTHDGKSTVKTTLERQTLRVMDGQSCVASIHHWVKDETKTEVDQPGTRSVRFQLANHQASVTLEMDVHSQLISYEEYYPYGGTAIIAGKKQREVKLKDYRYSGKERDDNTGLYYYGFRYYAPWQGRWLKPDPAGTIDGLNVYAFVGGNPVTNVDVGGLVTNAPASSPERTKSLSPIDSKGKKPPKRRRPFYQKSLATSRTVAFDKSAIQKKLRQVEIASTESKIRLWSINKQINEYDQYFKEVKNSENPDRKRITIGRSPKENLLKEKEHYEKISKQAKVSYNLIRTKTALMEAVNVGKLKQDAQSPLETNGKLLPHDIDRHRERSRQQNLAKKKNKVKAYVTTNGFSKYVDKYYMNPNTSRTNSESPIPSRKSILDPEGFVRNKFRKALYITTDPETEGAGMDQNRGNRSLSELRSNLKAHRQYNTTLEALPPLNRSFF